MCWLLQTKYLYRQNHYPKSWVGKCSVVISLLVLSGDRGFEYYHGKAIFQCRKFRLFEDVLFSSRKWCCCPCVVYISCVNLHKPYIYISPESISQLMNVTMIIRCVFHSICNCYWLKYHFTYTSNVIMAFHNILPFAKYILKHSHVMYLHTSHIRRLTNLDLLTRFYVYYCLHDVQYWE